MIDRQALRREFDVMQHALARGHAHAGNTPGAATHRTRIGFIESNRFTIAGTEHHILLTIGNHDSDQIIIFINLDGDNAIGADILIFRELGFLDHAIFGGHDNILLIIEFANRQRGRNLLAFLHRQQIHQRLASRRPACLWHFIDLLAEHAAPVREEQQVIMGGGHHQLRHKILFLGGHGGFTLATTALGPVQRGRIALDITLIGNGHHHILFGDQIFD